MDARNTIPWSQQVDEDLYENSSSYITTDNKPGTKSRHQAFERVDFMRRNDNYNSGDKARPLNVVVSSSSSSSLTSSNNTSKKENFNYFRKMPSEENQKPYFGSSSDTSGRKPIDSSLSPDKSSAATAAAMASLNNKKKITWASIASQPAKPNKRNNIALKKKGPGMPPPPMIPGKHALNVNPWDYARSSFSSEPDFIPVNESETVPHPPQPQPQPEPQPQPQPLQQQQQQHQSEPGDNNPSKWKVQNSEQQHSDFSRKSNQQSANINTQNTSYNRPVNNKNDRRDFSNSDDIVPERSIVPRHQHQQHHEDESPNMNRQQSAGFGRMHNFNAARRPGPGMGPGQFAKSAECPPTQHQQQQQPQQPNNQDCSEVVLKQLKDRNNYNPMEIDMQNATLARYFVIKSYSEDDIHRSIKYEIWCSTDHGNKKLDEAFKERMKAGGNVMLYFSVNGSGHFCGMAQMMTPVDYKSTASVWSQDKWKGKFKVKWTYVKDVPNSQLRHIRLENNENKSVTNSRDTQEIPLNQGLQMLKIFHSFKHMTSIFDDFYHYEKKQEESVSSKKPTHFDGQSQAGPGQGQGQGGHSLSSSSNAYYGDNNKELNNDWHSSGNNHPHNIGGGNLKDRANFRGDQQQHYYANRNRKNGGKPIIMDMKRNIDAQDKSSIYNKGLNKQQQQHQQDNEDNTNTKQQQQQPQQQHNILEKHSNPSIENSSGSFNCNDNSNSNSIIRDDIHTK